MKQNYGSNSQSKCFISDSDSDDFEDIHKKRSSRMTRTLNSPTFTQFSDPESNTDYKFNKGTIQKLLPETYEYRFSPLQYGKSELFTFSCEFKINMRSEQENRKWVSEYNEKTKETMVYVRNGKGSGKHVVRKLFLHCHHNLPQTSKHTKSTKLLKTTFKKCSSKHTNCPAQINVTNLSPDGKLGK